MNHTKQHIVKFITIKHVRVRASQSPTADDKVKGDCDSATEALSMAWRKIRNLAETNTKLFLGLLTAAITLMTVLATIITYALNFFAFCIDYGYYGIRYNVPVDFLNQPQAANLSLNAVLGIILVLVLTTMNSLGVWAYRNCRSANLLLVVSSIIFTLLMGPFMELIISDFSWSLLIAALIVAIIFSIIIAFSLNIALIGTFIAPTTQDKLMRNRTKLAKWKSRKDQDRKKVADRIMQLEKQVHTLEQNEEERRQSSTLSKRRFVSVIAAFLVILTAVLSVSCVVVGSCIVKRNEIITVAGQEQILQEFTDVLPEECKANTLAVLYHGDDFLLVAPCVENNGTVVVYSSFQRIISSEGTILIYRTRQSVKVQ